MKESHDLKSLLTGMNRYIQDYIIDRGLVYYEQGLVEDVQIKEPWIRATVLGNYGDYKVQVHLTDFSKSRCNCPYDDYCKHIAAVVYYATREYAEQPGYSEPDGVPCAFASNETGTDTVPNRQPDDDMRQHLKSMGNDDLLETITRLMEIEPSIRETLRLILIERERTANLHSDRVRRMGLYSSLAYYQKKFPAVLKECESLFTEIETADEDDDDSYGYGYHYDDYTNLTEWDFTKGLEILHRYGQELLKMVTAEHYISGTVGLLVAVIGLEEWSDKYDDEYGDSELNDSCSEFENYLWEALERVSGYRLHDRQAQTFLEELIDWIVQQCKQLEGLLAWTSILNYCIPEPRYLWHLKERIMQLDKDFLRSASLQNEKHRRILASWWVELCLSLEQEEEAKQTAGIVEGSSQSDASVAYSFVRYYERRENWREAIMAMQTILNTSTRINPHDYQWIIRLCERSGDRQGMKDWYEKWFLSHPDFDLFKRNADLIKHDADKEAKIQRWLEHLKQKKEYELVIGIYLNLGDVDNAWSEFVKHKNRLQVDEPVLLKLFKTVKKHAPAKLIPVYRELALNNIRDKNRSAYARAARWMKELREVCGLSGNEEKWTAFHGKIMKEYRRFRALMEEIRAAGIGQS